MFAPAGGGDQLDCGGLLTRPRSDPEELPALRGGGESGPVQRVPPAAGKRNLELETSPQPTTDASSTECSARLTETGSSRPLIFSVLSLEVSLTSLFRANIEKDFVVVPIKGNIHCTGVSAARQRNRRRNKTKFKVLGGGLGYFSTQRLNCTTGLQYRLSGQAERSVQQGDQRGMGGQRGGARGGQPWPGSGLGDHGVR